MMFRRLLFMLSAALGLASCQGGPEIYDLRCEGLEEPLGIDSEEPHFSWKISSDRTVCQEAFEIEVASDPELLTSGRADLWKPGLTRSGESVMVPYGGEPLSSRGMYWWRVRVRTSGGASGWSPAQRFSIGIIGDDAFHGELIGTGDGEKSAVLVEKTFILPQADINKTSLLHVNSLGYHEAYVNGVKVTDAVLSPAVSQMDRRSLILTYDVTPLLRAGENSVVLWIGSGWYKKCTFGASYDGPAVRADLDVYGPDGPGTVLCTDGTWRGCPSGYEDTGDWNPWGFGGESIDARAVPSDLSASALADRSWKAVETVRVDGIEATPQMCRPTVVKETLEAVNIIPMGENGWLADFGKAVNAQIDFRLAPLPAGTRVEAVYADHIEEDMTIGDIGAADVFISSGSGAGDTFRNRFNHHCFRYVLLKNLPVMPDLADLKVHRIGYDGRVTGTFECSDPDLNAIHRMLACTMDNLAFCGYMVDCAHIERLGYGGDGNASTLSLQNNFDVAPLYMNWLQAWNDVIREDGGLPHTAPSPYRAGGGPYWCSFIVQAPWRVWMNYGDDRLLRRCYPSMKKWLEYVDAHTVDGLLAPWPETEYRSWYLGDWLPPTGVDPRDEESVALVNNCALAQSYRELVLIAEHLGLPEDAAGYTERLASLSSRINDRFLHPETSTYGTGVQIDMAYPLLAGVVPQESIEAVTGALKSYTQEKMDGHIGVGLVGVPVLAEWATLAGEADFIYGMLKKEDYPGYLYMLRHGATGTWEKWDSPRSYLHNCYNGMDSWFYQALGGIIPLEPGYRKVLIAPQYPEGVDWVKVTRETPYGTIKVEWRRGENGVEVDTAVPGGVTAVIKK